VTRIAIIGNAGGGKSLLAAHLGRTLALPVHAIDDVQWNPGWQRASPTRVAQAHEAWLASARWIIDGWGEWELIVKRFDAADTIVMIDFPLDVHERWALQRQREVELGERTDWPPRGCDAAVVTDELLRTIRYVHSTLRPRLLELLRNGPYAERLVVLRSPEALDEWRDGIRAA
jgi:hypothetical protein